MTPWRPAFVAALRLFAVVSEALCRNGQPRPILVGGAAVEYWTGGVVATGDFDLCSPAQEELETILRQHGFVRPGGPGRATRGWVHPDLGYGFEVVGRVPLDGAVAPERLILIDDIAPDAAFAILGVEDLIADRMGQYASGTARDRIDQARTLLSLHPNVDRPYLERRIRHESAGEYGIDDLDD